MSGTYSAVTEPVSTITSFPVSGSVNNIAPQDLTGWGDESGVWGDATGVWSDEK